MNDLFAIEAKPETFYAGGLRIQRVEGDGMTPTLIGGRDFVLIRPVHRYVGEGVYLVADGVASQLYRVQSNGAGGIRLLRDNAAYSGHELTRERFEEDVLGIVVADVKVRSERLLYESA